MKCTDCGFESKDNATFCESCGRTLTTAAPQNAAPNAQPNNGYQQPNNAYQQPNNAYGNNNGYNNGYQQQGNAQPQQNAAQIASYTAEAKSSMGFGIAGLILCWSLLGFIFCIVAISKSKKCIEPLQRLNAPYGQAKAGKICGTIGLIFAIISVVVGFILGIALGGTILAALGMDELYAFLPL